jgi:iron(III) transport system substrate-binding protein
MSGCASIHKSSRRQFLGGAVALALSSCRRTGSTGEVNIYSGRGEELIGPVVGLAEREMGIRINARYGNSAQMALAIMEEGKNSRADVFISQETGALGALVREGRLVPLPGDVLGLVDRRFRSPQGLWVGVSGRTRVIDYNTRLVRKEELPQSIHAVTQPRWRGKVGWAPPNGSFQAFVTAMRLAEGDEKTLAWLQAMKANGARAYPGNAPILEALGRGEVHLGLTNNYYLHRFTVENPDFPVAHHYTKRDAGALVLVSGAGLLDVAGERRENALGVIRFLLSAPAQEHFAKANHEYPLAAGVRVAEGRLSLGELDPPDIDLSRLDDLEGTMKLIDSAGIL